MAIGFRSCADVGECDLGFACLLDAQDHDRAAMHWRGHPLTDYRTIVDLIAATTTKTDLTVMVQRNKKRYHKGINVSAKERVKLNMRDIRPLANGITQSYREVSKLFMDRSLSAKHCS
jgi:hypothetical protein